MSRGTTADGPLLAERYRVIERLGSGGMAAVYLAHDERLDRRVAIKRLHASSDDDMDARRFEREAKIGASLSHPNLVSIFDTEQDDESVLLVMEYVEGETLADLLARGAVEPRRAVEIVGAVAEALDHAHKNGIVHRDIKPGNVLLGKDGSVKLADLGIAKAVERTDITGTGTVLGTPAYMAPEQLEGGKLGPEVDTYALATMAYEMFTGKRARRGRTAVEIAHQVVNEPAPDPRDVDETIPPAAASAIRSGMSRNPDERPPTATTLSDELAQAFAGQKTERTPPTRRIEQARPVAPVAQPARADTPPRQASQTVPTGRPGWILAAGALFAIAIAAIVIGLSSGGDDEGSSARNNDQKAAQGDDSKPAPSDSAPAQDEAAQSEAPPSEPVSVEGVPQAKGKGTIEEAHALHAEGHAALQAGDYKTAIKLNKQAIEAFPPGTTDPQYGYALFSLGQALRLDGHADKAIPILEARLQIPDQQATVQRELDAARAEAGE